MAICIQCGNEFASKRNDAVYDSDACRKAHKRSNPTMSDEHQRMMAQARELGLRISEDGTMVWRKVSTLPEGGQWVVPYEGKHGICLTPREVAINT